MRLHKVQVVPRVFGTEQPKQRHVYEKYCVFVCLFHAGRWSAWHCLSSRKSIASMRNDVLAVNKRKPDVRKSMSVAMCGTVLTVCAISGRGCGRRGGWLPSGRTSRVELYRRCLCLECDILLVEVRGTWMHECATWPHKSLPYALVCFVRSSSTFVHSFYHHTFFFQDICRVRPFHKREKSLCNFQTMYGKTYWILPCVPSD